MPKILIIEDDDNWRELLLSSIENDNFDIDEASSLKEARELLRANSYDLLIVDLKLANQQSSGTSHFGQLVFAISQGDKQPHGRVPTIIVTGRNFSGLEIAHAINDFPGWIWGWHEKRTFNDDVFRNNLVKILEAKATQKKDQT